jgi:hypothetical protein
MRALSPGSRGVGRGENPQAGDHHQMASRRVASLVAVEIKAARRSTQVANPLWGAPRIHGELLKLGIDVGQTTVAKYMAKRRRPPSQGWRTFVRNHADAIASIDMFVVPTISFGASVWTSHPATVTPRASVAGCDSPSQCHIGTSRATRASISGTFDLVVTWTG